MAFKLNRPFAGHVATFERPSEFFDWLCHYVMNSELGVSGMIWNDSKPVGTVEMVLEMGREAFLTKYDPTYDPEAKGVYLEDRILEDVANADAQDYIDQIHPPMVTYHAPGAPKVRFRDFKGKEPTWAVDIQPCADRS